MNKEELELYKDLQSYLPQDWQVGDWGYVDGGGVYGLEITSGGLTILLRRFFASPSQLTAKTTSGSGEGKRRGD